MKTTLFQAPVSLSKRGSYTSIGAGIVCKISLSQCSLSPQDLQIESNAENFSLPYLLIPEFYLY